jgi:hypothetical protein
MLFALYLLLLTHSLSKTHASLSVGCLLFADVNDHTWTYEHDFGISTLAYSNQYASVVAFEVYPQLLCLFI